jgi:hypothetical protein
MYRERVLLANGLQLEVAFESENRWSLALKKGKKALIEYKSSMGYEFRSVEKLRYDFEGDAESAQRKNR